MSQPLQPLLEPTLPWFDPRTGIPTLEFYQYLRDLDRKAREMEVTIADHETRITALEP